MIYEEMRLSPAGDRHVLAALGDDTSLEANFLVLNLAAALDEARVDGVVDVIPSYNSLLIQYDFGAIQYSDLYGVLADLRKSLPSVADIEIRSRLVDIPVHYLNSWTKDCIDDYRNRIRAREYDPEFLARVNGLNTVEEMVARHSGCEHWVVTVSSFPGLPALRALDPRCVLIAPKYNPPRTWTPVGAIGVGGASTSIYTIPSPGGYNLIGRTPTPVWQPSQRLAAFKDHPILLRAGDRVRFIPIGRAQYDEIEAAVSEARYSYRIKSGVFSMKEYRNRFPQRSIEVEANEANR